MLERQLPVLWDRSRPSDSATAQRHGPDLFQESSEELGRWLLRNFLVYTMRPHRESGTLLDTMALGSTIYTFSVTLCDNNRSVYESLVLRMARHPSETLDYLSARLLAFCLEHTESLAFGKGLSEPDQPAISDRDLTGRILLWIEVGAPSAERVHRASKVAERVAIYTHKSPHLLLEQFAGKSIHRSEEISLSSFDPEFLSRLSSSLDRRTELSITVSENELYLETPAGHLNSSIVRRMLR